MTESLSYRATFRCDKHDVAVEVTVTRSMDDDREVWTLISPDTGKMWFRVWRAFHPAESAPGGCQACRDEAVARAEAAWDARFNAGVDKWARKLCPELYECESCSSKPGSPDLCATCVRNRTLAGEQWKGPRPR